MNVMPPKAPPGQPEVAAKLSHLWRLGGRARYAAIGFPTLGGLLLPAQALLLSIVLSGAIVHGRSIAELWLPIAGVAGLFLTRAGLAWLGERASVTAAERAKRHLRGQVIDTLLHHGPAWTAARPGGRLAALLIDQIETMDAYLGRYLPALVQAAVLPVAFVLAVLPADGIVALLFVVAVPLIPLFMALVGWGAEAASRRQATTLGRLNGYFADRLRGLTTLKLLGRDVEEVAGVRRASEELRDRTMRVLRIAFLSSAVLEFFAALGVAGVALYVGLGLLGLMPIRTSPLSLEIGLFCLLMAPEVFLPMRTLAAHHHDRAAAKSALEVIEAEVGALAGETDVPDRDVPVLGDAAIVTPGLELSGVTISTPAGRVVIEECNLTVAAGAHIALLGASGSGKSTLLEAIAGLRPYAGTLRVGGHEVARTDEALRVKGLAMLGQRRKLFATSIAENIRLGRIDADDAAVVEAARRARVGEFADPLPEGLNSRLGENGIGLSGGEAQRVALARIYLRPAGLLLLDEPTSHLDAETEAAVLDGLFAFARGRTMIIATHSEAVAARADRCFHIAGGRVREIAVPGGVAVPEEAR